MCDALGIINFEGNSIDLNEMTQFRPLSAVSILGRYRVIDFVLSNMTNSGIDHIQVYIKNKPRSLIEHLGTGRHYNINSKQGKLHILYGEEEVTSSIYNTDIAQFMQNMQYIEESDEEYVVMAPSYMIYRADYNEILEEHIKSNADISVLYKAVDDAKDEYWACDTLTMDRDHRISEIVKNNGKFKNRNISLEAYILSKKLFIELVKKAAKTSSIFWFKDILAESCDELVIKGVSLRGYLGCINYLGGYYKVNMELKNYEIAKELFKDDWPIHTKTNDSAPTYFSEDAKVQGSVIANGCVIEGEVINSVIGRNVKIKKGSVVKNSIILPEAYIGNDVNLDTAIVDKHAVVNKVKELKGDNPKLPVYVKRRDNI